MSRLLIRAHVRHQVPTLPRQPSLVLQTCFGYPSSCDELRPDIHVPPIFLPISQCLFFLTIVLSRLLFQAQTQRPFFRTLFSRHQPEVLHQVQPLSITGRQPTKILHTVRPIRSQWTLLSVSGLSCALPLALRSLRPTYRHKPAESY